MIVIDKSNWTQVKISDIFEKKEENDKLNAQNRFDRFLKVEHMDAECLRIKRWSSQEAGDEINPTFYKIFRAGQVLFPTRNPHLRRTALADFDGICGEKTLTLEPKKGLVDGRFIPFLFHSEGFYSHSTSAIIGSTNPHCRWRDIANYEFLLPPKEQQAELAELLWAMDAVIEKDLAVLAGLENCYKLINDREFSTENSHWSYVPLKEIAQINRKSLTSSTKPEYRFKYLDISSILEPKVMGELSEMSYSEAPSRARRVVSDNSIIIALVRPYQKSFVRVGNSQNIIASTGTAVVDILPKYNSSFVFHQFFSAKFSLFCENRMTGTSYPAITSKDLEEFEIAVSVDQFKMNKVSNELDQIDANKIAIKTKILTSKALQKSIINEIF